MTTNNLAGINIQWPWSEQIVSGQKSIETRRYQIPAHYINKPLAIIETPGPLGKSKANIQKARVIGIITFSKCYRYTSKKHWVSELKFHQIPQDHPMFAYNEENPPWAWVIQSVKVFHEMIPAPKKRGIVFTTQCLPSKALEYPFTTTQY